MCRERLGRWDMKTRAIAIITSATVVAVMSIILVGKTREEVAESAAQCMEDTRDLNYCSRPTQDGLSLWESVAILTVLGAMASAFGITAGRYGD
jgi:hypothetical protein